jgi:hypothetical protein
LIENFEIFLPKQGLSQFIFHRKTIMVKKPEFHKALRPLQWKFRNSVSKNSTEEFYPREIIFIFIKLLSYLFINITTILKLKTLIFLVFP